MHLGVESRRHRGAYVQSAVYPSLFPGSTSSNRFGRVWIPGLMVGMTVSGASPAYAGTISSSSSP
jgi:putative ABC transport system permease protein